MSEKRQNAVLIISLLKIAEYGIYETCFLSKLLFGKKTGLYKLLPLLL